MLTAVFTDPAFLGHDTGHGHPERADRIRVIDRLLEGEEYHHLDRLSAPMATREQILRAHPEDHVDAMVDAMPRQGHAAIDGDTILSAGSREAIFRAVGAACNAVDEVVAGRAPNAFCAVRPPGHHAESIRAMGFCVFNSVAIAAEHARQVHGLDRIAVIDFDVHHGNGTQDIFWNRRGLFYASTHQAGIFPGTGHRGERGEHDNIVNAPLSPLAGSPEFRAAMTDAVLPPLERFEPDLVIISAGFDGHARDPLANLQLTEDDFRWATQKLCDIADRACGGRVVSVLEGGYDLDALSRSVAAHLGVLMGR